MTSKHKLIFLISTVVLLVWVSQKKLTHPSTPYFEKPMVSLPQALALPTSSENLSDIAEKAVKSVVNIASVKIVKVQPLSPFFNDPFFGQFFGEEFGSFGVPQEQRQRSLGSGVIVSNDGYVLTNNHVVNEANEVRVMFDNQTELPAKLIGTDPNTDVALIQVQLPKTYQPLPLGNSDQLRLAEGVLAIGSPFGLGGTVTQGIVSAKGRANVGIVEYEDFIQTDAAINPGNSGGALINLRGELIGINTAIYSKSGGYQGIGFAIPINMARHVMNELIAKGYVERGWIGVKFQDLNAEIAKALGTQNQSGAVISGVYRGSPADQAGLKPGDVIIKYNNERIQNSGHLSKMLSETQVGKTITLEINRNQRPQTVQLKMAKVPAQSRQR